MFLSLAQLAGLSHDFPQVLIQLRKFSERIAAEKARAGSSASAPPSFAGSSSGAGGSGGSKASGKGLLGQDMSEVLSTGESQGPWLHWPCCML